uniref:Protein sleepless n=1 Tax=Romanomermis culicivorax TaxID=13658 RepID=A0A915JFI5_ROMCU
MMKMGRCVTACIIFFVFIDPVNCLSCHQCTVATDFNQCKSGSCIVGSNGFCANAVAHFNATSYIVAAICTTVGKVGCEDKNYHFDNYGTFQARYCLCDKDYCNGAAGMRDIYKSFLVLLSSIICIPFVALSVNTRSSFLFKRSSHEKWGYNSYYRNEKKSKNDSSMNKRYRGLSI